MVKLLLWHLLCMVAVGTKDIRTFAADACPATGDCRYVSTVGSDSNDGSARHPWATIQHAVNRVNPGETVIVGDGTYAETVKIWRGGTSAAPVIIQAQHQGAAKISPASTVGNRNYTLYFSHVNYVSLVGFELTGTTTTDAGIKFDSGTNNKVIGNNIHDIGVSNAVCTSGAAVLDAAANNTVDGNQIFNIGPPRSAGFRCNQQHGIYITDGGDNAIVQNNLIFEVWQGYGIHINAATNISGLIISHNTVFNVGDTLHNSGGTFILDCHAACDNNTFNNNIFANTQGGFCFWEIQESGATLGRHNVYQNNLLFNCGSNIWVNGKANFTGTVTADPQFVHYTGNQTGDYHLQPASPAIHRGTRRGVAATDFDGVPRPQGYFAVDIGAYEYKGSS
jgi:hypothetical protein